MIKRGDLIRVRDGFRGVAAFHGVLWVVTERGDEDDVCGGYTVCANSLATGASSLWFPHEYDIGARMAKKGDLIRAHTNLADKDLFDAHGHLWVVLRTFKNHPERVFAKSVATGYEYVWFEDEYDA